MNKLLICYYTETNSTKEVAEFIGEQLEKYDYEIDIRPISETKELDFYSHVIIGAPIQGLRWHQKALEFVINNAIELQHKETVFFALGMLAYNSRPFWQKKIYKALEKPSKYVHPAETAIFGGVTNGDMPSIGRFIFGLPKNMKQDQRDWSFIEAWAANLGKKLEKKS